LFSIGQQIAARDGTNQDNYSRHLGKYEGN